MQFGFPSTFVLCFHQHEAIDPWSCFMNRFDHTSFKHLSDLLSKGFLKVHWYRPAGCLFWCNGWICMDVVWLTWKSACSFKEFWILFFDLLLSFDNLDFLSCLHIALWVYFVQLCIQNWLLWILMGIFCALLLFYRSWLCIYLFLGIIWCAWYESCSWWKVFKLGFTSRGCNWNTVSHDRRTLPSSLAMSKSTFTGCFVSLLNMKIQNFLMRSTEWLVYTVRSMSFLASLHVCRSMNTNLYTLSGISLTSAQVSSCTHRYLLCLW